ncbi:FKBP-type peptidyl-prolyl cis-trans isomerase SlpA [Sinobacterium caligoides]|uniref:Peptidyl-prolyl cis-trans isomerase n=1 Tax=Sinobacterium caligoides TaxID=933926 RepID=A0A3N2D4Q3_9GAMM|nr:FKBP-type peptidyl-prolyl cis-trans isomerase [Sinobacterium caligoides]ROR94749.1 FKBP-type peptidyl-prolyl cis-trans isomerase SlpA [Sinobacterium caligoides]
MTGKSISKDSRVTLHFTLKLADGAVVDSTLEREQPGSFVMGDGTLLPGFEQALLGLQAGEKHQAVVTPEGAFGQPNPNNVQTMPRKQFKDMELELGLMLSFADANKAELPGVVRRITDEVVEIDFNHPLAGQDIIFEVEILEVA